MSPLRPQDYFTHLPIVCPAPPSFRDAGPQWEQAVTQGDVWQGVDADLLEEEEWRALADERAWRETREAMRRDGDGA